MQLVDVMAAVAAAGREGVRELEGRLEEWAAAAAAAAGVSGGAAAAARLPPPWRAAAEGALLG
jgi:hypothetical protein